MHRTTPGHSRKSYLIITVYATLGMKSKKKSRPGRNATARRNVPALFRIVHARPGILTWQQCNWEFVSSGSTSVNQTKREHYYHRLGYLPRAAHCQGLLRRFRNLRRISKLVHEGPGIFGRRLGRGQNGLDVVCVCAKRIRRRCRRRRVEGSLLPVV